MSVPSSELAPPPPLPSGECVSPPQNQRRGKHTRLRVRGWGSPNSDDWRKSLALCLLHVLPTEKEIHIGSGTPFLGCRLFWLYLQYIFSFPRQTVTCYTEIRKTKRERRERWCDIWMWDAIQGGKNKKVWASNNLFLLPQAVSPNEYTHYTV